MDPPMPFPRKIERGHISVVHTRLAQAESPTNQKQDVHTALSPSEGHVGVG